MIYLAIDGDRIGDHLERYFLTEDLDAARQLSDLIKERLDDIASVIGETGDELFKGGDSVLIKLDTLPEMNQLKSILWDHKIVFSCGISDSIRGSWLALKMAKVTRPSIVSYFKNEIDLNIEYKDQ